MTELRNLPTYRFLLVTIVSVTVACAIYSHHVRESEPSSNATAPTPSTPRGAPSEKGDGSTQ